MAVSHASVMLHSVCKMAFSEGTFIETLVILFIQCLYFFIDFVRESFKKPKPLRKIHAYDDATQTGEDSFSGRKG